jgi:uncharacterized protein
MALSLLVSAWLVGILGGLHCFAMCGGFAAALAGRDTSPDRAPGAPMLPARSLAWSQRSYHAGRVATYALLGAGFGAAGATLLDAAALAPVQRLLYAFANVFLLGLGLSLAFGRTGAAWLQRGGAALFARALPLLRPWLARPGHAGRIALGLTWGLMPCGLVYSVLPLAAFAGGTWQGALVMVAFGAGTVPNFLVAGALLQRAQGFFSGRSLRLAAALVVIGFAIAGIYRIAFVPEALGHGAFCLVA